MEEIILLTREQLKHLIVEAVGIAIAQQGLAPHPSKERYLNTAEAAEFIKKSPNALRQIVHKGEVKSIKRGNNLLFRESDLVEYIEKGVRVLKDEDVDPATYLV